MTQTVVSWATSRASLRFLSGAHHISGVTTAPYDLHTTVYHSMIRGKSGRGIVNASVDGHWSSYP